MVVHIFNESNVSRYFVERLPNPKKSKVSIEDMDNGTKTLLIKIGVKIMNTTSGKRFTAAPDALVVQ